MQLHTLSATRLLDLLNQREINSRELVQALIDRRAAVDPKVRAFVVQYDEQALAQAHAADEARTRGESLGPLHGLPITIKENVDIAGSDSTMGLRSRQGQPATMDSVTVQAVKRAGAVILGKTNVPQLLLAQETENVIWGITHNPWNLGRSPGGSSGGEAAALATGQTPLGIGTDIGGSIRIPAHFCGVAGLKPTIDRWSNRGSVGAIPGQELVRAQIGPMAREAEDVALLMRALDPQFMARLDPAVAPMAAPDPSQVDVKGLRIGVFTDDGFLRPDPALQRAVREAAQVLKDAGATLIDYTPPGAQELLYVWLAGISSDGGETMRGVLAGEEVARQILPSMRVARMPMILRKSLAGVMGAKGERRLATLLRSLGGKPVQELWRLTAERTALRRAEFDAWNLAGLDAVLCPPHAIPAMPLGTSGHLTLTLSYAFRYVMLNFPAGVVPVTRVQAGEQTRADAQEDVEKRCAQAQIGTEGLPVGVQVVGRPYREDVVLAVMQAVQQGVRGNPGYPQTPVDPMG
jgi:fatty acid amide hydrolase